jgi:hypothetical protein
MMDDLRQKKTHDQEQVARHLLEAVRQRFAGESAAFERMVRSDPAEQVVLGVLDPREPPLDPPSHPELPDEPGVPVDILPPSEMGVTVWIDPPVGATEVTFAVDVTFDLYLPAFPTWDEQKAWMTGARTSELDGGELDDASKTDDEDQAIGDDQLLEEQPSTDAEAGPDEGDDAETPPPEAPTAKKTAKSVRLAPVHVRHSVAASTSVTLPLVRGSVTDGGAVQRALDAAVASATVDLARPLKGRAKYGVPSDVILAGAAQYEQNLAERVTDEAPPLPSVEFLASATPDPRGGWRVALTLANSATLVERRRKAQQCLYDTAFTARLEGGTFKNFGYRLSDKDWRTDPQVFAHGRFCVGEVSDDGRQVSTNTWPIYTDKVFESRPELQPTFRELIDAPVATLEGIRDNMARFVQEWASFARSGDLEDQPLSDCLRDLATFEDEAARFARGIDLLRRRPLLLDAFVAANQAFLVLNTPNALHPDQTKPRGEPRITSWRLFQIVFIVLGLASLAAREDNDPDLDTELDIADVLWFPTGGGKSEAFLGLVAVAMFYDRLRGKLLGLTALIRFPLRMLSVQQLDRVLRLVTACEHVRTNTLAGAGAGDPFELGYFVGKGNTPNRLTSGNDDRWGDINRMAGWSEEQRRRNVVITTCPYCGSTDVELVADRQNVRLNHLCTGCEQRIPVVISDDEVFRYIPAVVVATVDKLAAIAFQPHFSHFTHGPAFRCPDHGFVTFAAGSTKARRCLARTFCNVDPDDWTAVEVHDPAPALIIQDELHLLAEDLGTLAAHYETLFAHLCRAGSGRAPKVIAATATISDYENQVLQLYALTPRRFPSEGYREGETFYASRLDLTRRLFVGVLPSRIDTAQFGIAAGNAWRAELDRLRTLTPADTTALLDLQVHTTADEIAALLFRYELQLFYANRKNDAERTYEQMRRAGENGPSHFDAELLTGNTPLAEISAAIRRVDSETLGSHPDPAERLAVVAGTSLVSHGVDLARLNVLHVAGMPSTNAYYVQATARAGRTDVGVVFTAFSRSFARDRSAFHFFEPHHAYANQLVEAVSLNRFAVNGPKKTATGVLSAVIINRLARDGVLNPRSGHEIPSFQIAATFRDWLAKQHAAIDADIEEEVLEAYGLRAAVLDPIVADYFADAVRSRLREEMGQLRSPTQSLLQGCYLNKPLTSFRDIDEPVEFGAYGYHSRNDFKTLTDRNANDRFDGGEVAVAVEREEAD